MQEKLEKDFEPIVDKAMHLLIACFENHAKILGVKVSY